MITQSNRTTLRAATALVSAVALIGVSAAPALAHSPKRQLKTILSGANEFNATTGLLNAGDPDGSGKARVKIDLRKGLLCYDLRVKNIDAAVAAHIHEAAAGANGAIVVTLAAPTNGRSRGCLTVPTTLLTDIRTNPSKYYVNVHNVAFPGGAVRGQLASKR